ncbi:MAG: ABC transporter substrate-binding protein [Acidobacteriota bacterium]
MVIIIFCFAILSVVVGCPRRDPHAPTRIRIAGTPHQDTTLYMWGMQKGYFRERGVELDIRDTTFNEQIEFAAGGGCDIAMATVDEIAAKSKNLTLANRRVNYLLPAWLFEGQIFVSRPDLASLAELKQQYPAEEARHRFFEQIRGKIIAVPEGSSYDQALRRLMKESGYDPADFRFVNSQLEAGINGLSDRNVALAAAGIVERPEAEGRGYKVALDSLDLEMIVIAGFICRADFYEKHRDAVDTFLSIWFTSVNEALAHPRENYEIFHSYLSNRGAKVPSFDEYEGALRYTRFARNPAEVRSMFLDESAPSFWRKPWDARIQQLRESGQADQVPSNTNDFIADDVVSRLAANESKR